MRKSIFFALALVISDITLAKVIYVGSHGFSIENRVDIAQPIGKVWQALIQDVDAWWPKDHSWFGDSGQFYIEPKAGGCFCEVAGKKSAEHMRISFVDPERLLRMTGGLGPLQGMSGAMDWKLSESDGKTTVLLTYKVSGYYPDGFEQLAPIVAKVQGIQLNGLKSLMDKH